MKLNKVFLIILTLSSSLLFSEPNEDFVFSASQNNLAGLKLALAAGADINAKYELE